MASLAAKHPIFRKPAGSFGSWHGNSKGKGISESQHLHHIILQLFIGRNVEYMGIHCTRWHPKLKELLSKNAHYMIRPTPIPHPTC